MRVLHTSDFHAGYTLRGFDRTPEIAEALSEIAEIAISEKVDALLVAGDVFDRPNPSPQAEAAIFDFFLRLHHAKIPSVIISGNHDSAARLGSLGGLMQFVGAHVIAEPLDLERMSHTIETASGEKLCVHGLPYLSERKLVKALDLLTGDVGSWRQRYRAGVAKMLSFLAENFQLGAVNMLMAHTTIDGSKPSGSERGLEFDLANSYTLTGLQIPAAVQYMALGHIHKPQDVCDVPRLRYSGSIIQLDFGEAGEEKQVSLIEATVGKPVNITPIPLRSGQQLKTVHVELKNLEAQLAKHSDFVGHLKVVVNTKGGSTPSGLKDRVLRILPNVLAIELQGSSTGHILRPEDVRSGMALIELYERYWRDEKGRGELPQELREIFLQVEQEAVQLLAE